MAAGKKYGGRTAGTPNRVTGKVRESIAGMLDEYFSSDSFAKDMAALEPRDRVLAMEKFTAYVAPKLQSTALDMSVEGRMTIEDRLRELAGEDEA